MSYRATYCQTSNKVTLKGDFLPEDEQIRDEIIKGTGEAFHLRGKLQVTIYVCFVVVVFYNRFAYKIFITSCRTKSVIKKKDIFLYCVKFNTPYFMVCNAQNSIRFFSLTMLYLRFFLLFFFTLLSTLNDFQDLLSLAEYDGRVCAPICTLSNLVFIPAERTQGRVGRDKGLPSINLVMLAICSLVECRLSDVNRLHLLSRTFCMLGVFHVGMQLLILSCIFFYYLIKHL